MATFRVRPSKPVAIFSSVIALGILIFFVVKLATDDSAPGTLWFFVVVPVIVIAFNLWAAFAKNGAINTIESDDGPPVKLGTTAERADR